MPSPTFDFQPMSLGDILDRSVRLYRRHFLHTIGIASVPYILIIPGGAFVGATAWLSGDPRTFQQPDLIGAIVLVIVVVIWLSFMSMGALTLSVSEWFLGGSPTIWGSYQHVLRRTFALMWAYFLAFLAWGGMGVMGAILIGVAWVGGPLVVGPVVLAVVVVALIAFVRLFLITQVIVVEDVRGVASLRRSWVLMRRNFWRAVLIFLFAVVVALVLSFALQFPVSLLASLRPTPAMRILDVVMRQVAQIITVPFASIAFTLLYYDSRIRQEAFDLEMMAKNLGVSAGPSAPSQISAPIPSAPPRSAAPAGPQARPAGPTRAYGAFKVCPKCGAQVPNIQPTCGKCGTRVPFGLSKQ